MTKNNIDQENDICHTASENKFWVKGDTTRERFPTSYPYLVPHVKKIT